MHSFMNNDELENFKIPFRNSRTANFLVCKVVPETRKSPKYFPWHCYLKMGNCRHLLNVFQFPRIIILLANAKQLAITNSLMSPWPRDRNPGSIVSRGAQSSGDRTSLNNCQKSIQGESSSWPLPFLLYKCDRKRHDTTTAGNHPSYLSSLSPLWIFGQLFTSIPWTRPCP